MFYSIDTSIDNSGVLRGGKSAFITTCHKCMMELDYPLRHVSEISSEDIKEHTSDNDLSAMSCDRCKAVGCAHCGSQEPLRDYNGGHATPLMLCEECEGNEADRANERSQGDAWEGGFADNH